MYTCASRRLGFSLFCSFGFVVFVVVHARIYGQCAYRCIYSLSVYRPRQPRPLYLR